jgi:chromosome segregation ATPase
VLSSALFALASALVLGIVYLLARYAENRFMAELEDFLAARAQLPSSLLGGEGTLPAFLEALLAQTADNLSDIQRMMLKGEEERRLTDAALNSLHSRLGDLADQLAQEQKMFHALTKSYADLHPALTDLGVNVSGAIAGTEETRAHLRNVDLQLGRVVEELRATREEVPQAIRQEIRLLAQTLAAPAAPRARPEPRPEPRVETRTEPRIEPQDPNAPAPPWGANRRKHPRPERRTSR